MASSLQDIQNMMAAELDQSATITAGTSDWNLRLAYINWAQRDFSESYDWRALFTEVNTLTSQASGNATVSLPWDYRKLAGYPFITYDGQTTKEFPEINAKEKTRFLPTDLYVTTVGNPNTGYSMVINPASIVSGASIYYSYYAVLPSLASPTDVSKCPDSLS